ncbi:purple acid phosphatase-like protein [Chitinophaga skermanii]|uniref:Purple acid phosphatase-like protein n=1 Tax=Chitinophaga skermanii TaxID=331697 RepID=A0A327R4Z2_9BACT|nr:metallophosphoesterase [Chitinophaga skermanii]RAJ10824.1 purple acid phosphatase-like protein [Chitinophaga skermanii]
MSTKNQQLNRRNFLGNVSKAGLLGVFGISPLASTAKNVLQDNQSPPLNSTDNTQFLCAPYLQNPGSTHITIFWLTNKPCYSWVEFGENAQQLSEKAHHVTNGLVDANSTLHKIVLTDLKPNTTYYYKAVSKEIVDFQPYKLTYGETIFSEVYSFTTINPAAKETSWLILNDIHDRPNSFKDLISLNGNDPYDFVFLNGDMFDYQTGEQQLVDHLFKPTSEVFASEKPFLFVRGNHETRGKFARQIDSYFDNPNNRYYYSFTRGPVHAIVLDTGEDKEDTHPVYAGIVDFDQYREQQQAWLKRAVQTPEFKKAKYRVVMMHIPHYHSDEAHGTVHCRELFGPIFNDAKIDLFIAGHTHKFGIYQPEAGKHNYPFVIGGGPKAGNRTLIKVKANQEQLVLTMLKDDGSEIGTVKVKGRK